MLKAITTTMLEDIVVLAKATLVVPGFYSQHALAGSRRLG